MEKLPGIKGIVADFPNRQCAITYQSKKISAQQILVTIKGLGFKGTILQEPRNK